MRRGLALLCLLGACRRDAGATTDAAIEPAARDAGGDAGVVVPSDGAADDGRPPPFDPRATLERARVPAISVAVVRDGRVGRAAAWGVADASTGRTATAGTAFEAASIAKTVIGLGAMRLVERGAIGLDDDVSTKLPFSVRNPRHPKAPITLAMLLAHTSSIHDRVDALAAATEPATAAPGPRVLSDFLRAYLAPGAAQSFLASAPGAAYEYSNVGAALAALVIERATGEPFDAWSRREVLALAGAPGAAWRAAGVADRASGHRYVKGAHAVVPAVAHAVWPVVDLYGTARELAGLLALAMGARDPAHAPVLSSASLAAMLAPRPSAPEQGLGWQLPEVRGRKLVGHEGEDAGASTLMFFDPKTRVGAVVLANGDAFASGDPDRAAALRDVLLSLLDGAW